MKKSQDYFLGAATVTARFTEEGAQQQLAALRAVCLGGDV